MRPRKALGLHRENSSLNAGNEKERGKRGRPASESATGIRDLDGDAARRLDGNRSMKTLDGSSLGGMASWQGSFGHGQREPSGSLTTARQCHREGLGTRFGHHGGPTSKKPRMDGPSRLMASQSTVAVQRTGATH